MDSTEHDNSLTCEQLRLFNNFINSSNECCPSCRADGGHSMARVDSRDSMLESSEVRGRTSGANAKFFQPNLIMSSRRETRPTSLSRVRTSMELDREKRHLCDHSANTLSRYPSLLQGYSPINCTALHASVQRLKTDRHVVTEA